MAKFIEVAKFNLTVDDTDIVVKERILLNSEKINWIGIKKYSSGYAVLVDTNQDYYVYDCRFEREADAYEKIFKELEELNK
jgi:hypothetical protein